MSRGNEKWPSSLDAAIREEIVRGKLRPIEVWEKICAGTLDGLDPIPIPRRSFYYRWEREATAVARGGEEQAQFPRLIHRLMAAMVDRHGDLGPEQLAEAINEEFGKAWTTAEAARVIEARVEWAKPSPPARVGRDHP